MGLVRVVVLRPVFHTLLLSELPVLLKLGNLVRRDNAIVQALRFHIPAHVVRRSIRASASNSWNASRANCPTVLSRCSRLPTADHATIALRLVNTSDALCLSFASLMPWSIVVVGCAVEGVWLPSALSSVMQTVNIVHLMVDCRELLAGLQVPGYAVLDVDDPS